jgi:hypothetical protein
LAVVMAWRLRSSFANWFKIMWFITIRSFCSYLAFFGSICIRIFCSNQPLEAAYFKSF